MTDFYINLPQTAPIKSISALYIHALGTLKKESMGAPLELECFDLTSSYTDDDLQSVHVRFNELVTEHRHQEGEVKSEGELNSIKAKTEQTKLHRFGDKLHAIEVRMPHGKNQDNDIELVEGLIGHLELIDDRQILDIIYHDYCDDDGVRRPYFRCYFLN